MRPAQAELERLAARLDALRADIEMPATPPLRAAVLARLQAGETARSAGATRRAGWERFGWRRRAALALAALTALLAASLAVPPWRDAVAGWLRLRGVTVERTAPPVPRSSVSPQPGSATPSPPGAGLDLGDQVSLDTAGGQLSFSPLLPSAVGRPDAVWVRTPPAGGALTLVYLPGAGRPPADPATGVSLLVTELRGDLAPTAMAKFLGPTARADQVAVGADDGLWITGTPHGIAFRLPDGTLDSDTVRLARDTLLWQHGPLLLRIEGAPTLEAALAVALSFG